MQQQQWQTGDVVVLKSDRRPMTVREILPDGDVHCQWIEPNGDVKYGCFQPAMLVQYETPRIRSTVAAFKSGRR